MSTIGSISWDELKTLASRCKGFSSFKSSAIVVEDSGLKVHSHQSIPRLASVLLNVFLSLLLQFVVRIADALNHKPITNPKPSTEEPSINRKWEDPFENPSTKDLFLKQLSETHSLMMNKFNVQYSTALIALSVA